MLSAASDSNVIEVVSPIRNSGVLSQGRQLRAAPQCHLERPFSHTFTLPCSGVSPNGCEVTDKILGATCRPNHQQKKEITHTSASFEPGDLGGQPVTFDWLRLGHMHCAKPIIGQESHRLSQSESTPELHAGSAWSNEGLRTAGTEHALVPSGAPEQLPESGAGSAVAPGPELGNREDRG